MIRITGFAGVGWRMGFLALGLVALIACGKDGAKPTDSGDKGSSASKKKKTVWTCSMHPQIRVEQPGKCPICDMALIPAGNDSEGEHGGVPHLNFSEHALAMASVETALVEHRELKKELRAFGMIQFNEQGLATITSRVNGYVERLFVDYSGIEVKKGDHLVEIYSPELVVAQKELLLAVSGGQDSLIESVKIKLRRLDITDAQIDDIIRARKPTERMTIYSPSEGTVYEKMIVERSSVSAGDALYRIANLDSVWVYLDIYEYELPWVRPGQNVRITAEAFPGETFTGLVTFIEPLLNEKTRTIKVRVNIANRDHKLKPGMFVSTLIEVPVMEGGTAGLTGLEGKYDCPMHPDIVRDEPGNCPVCGMKLVLIGAHQTPSHEVALNDNGTTSTLGAETWTCPMHPEIIQNHEGNCPICKMKLEKTVAQSLESALATLAVPITAVLDSGLRKLVYVERSKGRFEPVEVEVGPKAGAFYPVFSGLAHGDRVALRGNFLLDSQFQVSGLPSLLYKDGLSATSAHNHGDTPPPATETSPSPAHQH